MLNLIRLPSLREHIGIAALLWREQETGGNNLILDLLVKDSSSCQEPDKLSLCKLVIICIYFLFKYINRCIENNINNIKFLKRKNYNNNY